MKLDLAEVMVASNACILGPATAAALAASKGWPPLVAPGIQPHYPLRTMRRRKIQNDHMQPPPRAHDTLQPFGLIDQIDPRSASFDGDSADIGSGQCMLACVARDTSGPWSKSADYISTSEETSMAGEKFDTGSVGRVRFGLGALIGSGLALFTIGYYDPSGKQLLLGVVFGAFLFLLRRILLDKKRFRSRWRGQQIGLLTFAVAMLLVTYFALRELVPELATFTIARHAVWICLAGILGFVLESVDGFIFYTRRKSLELNQRISD